MLPNTTSAWGSFSKTLHWLTVFLILAAVTLGWVAELWPVSLEKINLFVMHKSLGITILVLVIVRLFWKIANPVPAAASGISEANHRLAHLGHWALYAILLAMPLSGWLLNSAANFPFKWLGLFAVPNLIEPNELIQGQAERVHFVLFLVLTALVFGHAAAAIWHHLSHKSDLLIRMLPAGGKSSRPAQLFATLAVLILLGSVMITWAVSQSDGTSDAEVTDESLPPTATSTVNPPNDSSTNTAAGRSWDIDHAQSRLGFTGLYAGVDFDGEFEAFSAKMIFDPENPADGIFDVTIDTTSINTNSADRDSMMPEKDWFHFQSFPIATYVTREFSQTAPEQYLATGVLNIKGIEQAVDLPFSWTIEEGGTAHMTAETTINRIEFGLGARDWADDDTIGFEVIIKIDLLLTE